MKKNKKKILMMSDDLRMHSGVAVMSKEIVMGAIHHYDFVQIGGSVKHPEEGKIVDMSQAVRESIGVKDAYLKIYPTSGYGSQDMLRQIIEIEKPDAVLHYTDPRFWLWFYQMEHEIRTKIPIFYYEIWDDLPDPKYNRDYYLSCDLLMAISKQTYGINKRLVPEFEDWQITYVPHGINTEKFFKINPNNSDFIKFKKEYDLDEYDFKILYLNRNIRRKVPGDVVMAYKHFVEQLPKNKQKKCVLIFHTAPVDDNGTDLRVVCKTLIPDQNVIFTYDKGGPFDDIKMNYLYNAIDVYVNIASNEGFGLGSAEALTVGKPIIVNVTGGLQDQCGFKKRVETSDGDTTINTLKYLTPDDYIELGSNHQGKYKKHGKWVKPVWPKTLSLLGSPPTPYIFDDRCRWDEVGDAMKEWYDVGVEERERCGELGRKFVCEKDVGMTAKEMCNRFIESMDSAFEKWKPKSLYDLIKIEDNIKEDISIKVIGDQA
tara:strand:+ start:1003 stop:2460 length:1458 start_codon:yes stop_codon:yes gene_type:complete